MSNNQSAPLVFETITVITLVTDDWLSAFSICKEIKLIEY